MSSETSQWLNENVLVGYTDQRGTAWHYKASDQGSEPNHYPGAIPIEDVRRRLFFWEAEKVPMYVAGPTGNMIAVPNRIAVIRNDSHDVLGVASTSYEPHQYGEWLVDTLGNILDDDLQIGSAGLLKGGAIAWVQVEQPETRRAAGEVDYRSHLLATTSFNGSIATLYKPTVTVVVCDNTRNAALEEHTPEVRVRHTANSMVQLSVARDALGIVLTMDKAFEAEVEELLSRRVSDRNYELFLKALIPLNDMNSKQAVSRNDTITGDYMKLWQDDPRVAPWRGSAFGVVQAVNTYRQHIRPTRGSSNVIERNMMDTLTGVTEQQDKKALELLDLICV